MRRRNFDVTILRPALFMEGLTEFAVQRQPGGAVEVSLALSAARSLQLVSVLDIADVVAAALLRPAQFSGRTIELAGDELSGRQIAHALGRQVGQPARYSPTPTEVLESLSPDLAAMFTFVEDQG